MAGYNNVKYEIVMANCYTCVCEEIKPCFRVDNSGGEYLSVEFCFDCIQKKFVFDCIQRRSAEADEVEKEEKKNSIAVKAEMYSNLFDWLIEQEFIEDCYDDSTAKVLREFTADDVLTFLRSSCWAHYQNRHKIIYQTFRKKFDL